MGAEIEAEIAGAAAVREPAATPLQRLLRRARTGFREATSPLRLLPDYLVVGAARAGSTSLYSYLVRHPLVGAASHKEIHFFDLNYERGASWYRRHFPTVASRELARRRYGSDLITGEASPYYLFHPHVPGRVRALLPDVRLIVLLRDPVARAYSQYQLERRAGRERLSFEEAIEREEERIGAETARVEADPGYASSAHRHFSYLARGIYAPQLERWLALFPREQLLVLRSEDLFADPPAVFRQALAFLELPPWELPQYRAFNYSPYPEMSPSVRTFLAGYFREDNQRLSDLLGRDFGWGR